MSWSNACDHGIYSEEQWKQEQQWKREAEEQREYREVERQRKIEAKQKAEEEKAKQEQSGITVKKRTMSEETKRKISEAMKKRYHKEEI